MHAETPSKQNRFKILEVHAKNRPLIPRKGHSKYDDNDELLLETARITPGFSGAGLENLLNEATILAVRRGEKIADMNMILELLELQSIGLKQGGLSAGTLAKEKLALFHASRAIACCINSDLRGQLKFVSLGIRKKKVTGLVFEGLDVTDEELRWWDILQMSNSGGGDAANLQQSLLPLCVGRAAEEYLFGTGSISQLSVADSSKASQLSQELISSGIGGKLHPGGSSKEVLQEQLLLLAETQDVARAFVRSNRNAIQVSSLSFAPAHSNFCLLFSNNLCFAFFSLFSSGTCK